jgi:hypothetical protein
MAAWAMSFQRPDSPSERFLEIFDQSSRKPRAALAIAVPNTARLAASYSPRMRKGTETARKITSPPMVGVPALPAWAFGPSSRMCWPNSRSRRKEMNLGPRNMQMSSEAMPAMRISPSMDA